MVSSLSGVLLALATTASAPDLPRPEDVVAGFQANYSSFRTLRVLWRRETGFNSPWFDYLEWLAQESKKDAEDSGRSATELAEATRSYQNTRKTLDTPGFRDRNAILSEFLTDRSAFQLRVFARPGEGELPKGYTFTPRVDATPETLPTVFGDVMIVSRGNSADDEYRTWHGIKKGRFYKAEVGPERIKHARSSSPRSGSTRSTGGMAGRTSTSSSRGRPAR